MTLLTDQDIYLFKEGSHFNLYDKLGAHPLVHGGVKGTLFAVWAPNAERVSVIGEFNNWNKGAHPLQARPDGSGIWEGFIPGIGPGPSTSTTSPRAIKVTAPTRATPLPFAGRRRHGRPPSYATSPISGETMPG